MMTKNALLEYRFDELLNANLRPPQYSTIPKIQWVAYDIRNRKECEKHYSPKLVSMGPIHHGRTNLELGEKYKLKWAAKYIQNSRCNPKDLFKEIADNIDQWKCLFADKVFDFVSWEGFNSLEEKLSWMLFVDGCSLLHILDIEIIEQEVENGKADKLFLVFVDVFLSENQLPYQLLKLLWKSDDSFLYKKMCTFVEKFCSTTLGYTLSVSEHVGNIEPFHLLDLLHSLMISNTSHEEHSTSFEYYEKQVFHSIVRGAYMNVQELRAKGIRVKFNEKRRTLIDISFSNGWLNGELKLPEIRLDNMTVPIFLNLIAYEMCSDFKNNYAIGTFFAFMDSLIRQPEDVKYLRSADILYSNLGSDEELVKLFHLLAADVVPDPEAYYDAYFGIKRHVSNKLKTNMVRFLTNIRHPWTNIAVHAAELGLALALVQTWFTAHPSK